MLTERKFGLEYWVSHTPEKIAVYDTRHRLSYSELAHRAAAVATELSRRGIKRGDKLLVCLPNCGELVELFFAAVSIGAVLVPCNIQYKEHELKRIVAMTHPRFGVTCTKEHTEIIHLNSPEIEVLEIDISRQEDGLLPFIADTGTQKYREELNGRDPVVIVCTSGSSGAVKGVVMLYENLTIPSADIEERFHMLATDISFVPVPLCHMFGIMGMLVALRSGGTILTMQRFSGRQALELIEKERVTIQYCVATMYEREIECYETLDKAGQKPDLSSLRSGMIAGAPSIRKCIIWFEEMLKCRLLNAYGMTEVSALAMADLNDSEDVRYNKVGKPCTHAIVAVTLEDGSPAPVGQVGQVVCKGPGVMGEYYGQPEMTKKAYTASGWFMTGDMGCFDADGNISITGRKKDIIIRGGYNIVPYEVESVYSEKKEVCEVCLVGYPDKCLGERTALYISLAAGYTYTEQELRQWAAEELAKYKIPDKVIVLDELPKLTNGKLDKKEMKKMMENTI